MKIHLCCGDIRLVGYLNCDIVGKLTFEATEEEIKANETTLDFYYRYPFIHNEKERQKNKRPFIIDKMMNILDKWDFEDYSIEEIVMVSAWEHFSKPEINHIIQEINRVTKPGARVVVNFPDIKTTVNTYIDSDPFYCSTLVYCNFKDLYSIHKMLWTPKSFAQALGNGWAVYETNLIKNDYPAFTVEAIKVN